MPNAYANVFVKETEEKITSNSIIFAIILISIICAIIFIIIIALLIRRYLRKIENIYIQPFEYIPPEPYC